MKKYLDYYNSRAGFEKAETFTDLGERALSEMTPIKIGDKYIRVNRPNTGAILNQFGGAIGSLIHHEFNLDKLAHRLRITRTRLYKELVDGGLDLDDINRLSNEWHRDKTKWFNEAKRCVESFGDFYNFFILNYENRHTICRDLKVSFSELKRIGVQTGGRIDPIAMIKRRVALKSAVLVLSQYDTLEEFVRLSNYSQSKISFMLGITHQQWDTLISRVMNIPPNFIRDLKEQDRLDDIKRSNGTVLPKFKPLEFKTEKGMFAYIDSYIKAIGGMKELINGCGRNIDMVCDTLHIHRATWCNMVLSNPEYIRELFKINFKGTTNNRHFARVDGLDISDENVAFISHMMKFVDTDNIVKYVMEYITQNELETITVSDLGSKMIDATPNTLHVADRTKIIGLIATANGFRRESMIEECVAKYITELVMKCDDVFDFNTKLIEQGISFVKILELCNTPLTSLDSIQKGLFNLKNKEDELFRYINRMLNNGVFSRTKFNPYNYRSDMLTIIRALAGL